MKPQYEKDSSPTVTTLALFLILVFVLGVTLSGVLVMHHFPAAPPPEPVFIQKNYAAGVSHRGTPVFSIECVDGGVEMRLLDNDGGVSQRSLREADCSTFSGGAKK